MNLAFSYPASMLGPIDFFFKAPEVSQRGKIGVGAYCSKGSAAVPSKLYTRGPRHISPAKVGESFVWDKGIRVHLKSLFWISIANFIAQVPYYFHLYFRTFSDLKRLFSLPMVLVLILFLAAYALLVRRHKTGYWLMLLFLSMEFVFYLWNSIFSTIHGYGPFFQLSNPDPILRAVFAIGYANLFASGYFLFFLLRKREAFLDSSQ